MFVCTYADSRVLADGWPPLPGCLAFVYLVGLPGHTTQPCPALPPPALVPAPCPCSCPLPPLALVPATPYPCSCHPLPLFLPPLALIPATPYPSLHLGIYQQVIHYDKALAAPP